MKSPGVDLTDNIWLQYNVYNKGFIIDSKIAVVSSQNFSPAGVEENRDAGLIIDNEDVAQYFEKVFLSDLKTRTILATASPSTKAAKSGATRKPAAVKRTAVAKAPSPRKGGKKP